MEVQRQSYKTSKKAICSKARMLKARVPKFLTSRGGGHRWGRSARCTWMNLIGLVMSGRGVNVVMMLVLGLLGRLNLFRIAPFSSALQASDSRPLPSAPRLAFPRGASPLPHHQILDDTLARWGSHKKKGVEATGYLGHCGILSALCAVWCFFLWGPFSSFRLGVK